jgi:hypothetical protein
MTKRSMVASEEDTTKSQNIGDKSTTASTKQSMDDNIDRHHMISTAAYYRAEQRGFDGVREMQDWLEAEEEIDVKFYR